MNIQELREELQYFYDNQNSIGISIYALLNTTINNNLFKINIEDEASGSLKNMFLNSIENLIMKQDELLLLNLSTCDERANAIYLYDIDEIPEDLLHIDTILNSDDVEHMNIEELRMSSIKTLLVEIGNNEKQTILYKSVAPINVFKSSPKYVFLGKEFGEHPTRLRKIDEDLLRITSQFQLIKISNNLIVMDLNTIEKNFGFDKIIKKEATIGLNSIKAMLIVDNIEVLIELIEDLRYARKFIKIAKNSPVIKANIPNQNIINFCRTYTSIAGKIKFNTDGTKIILDTKASKDCFISLLMDNFLTSELTQFHYESVAKDNLENNSTDSIQG